MHISIKQSFTTSFLYTSDGTGSIQKLVNPSHVSAQHSSGEQFTRFVRRCPVLRLQLTVQHSICFYKRLQINSDSFGANGRKNTDELSELRNENGPEFRVIRTPPQYSRCFDESLEYSALWSTSLMRRLHDGDVGQKPASPAVLYRRTFQYCL